MLVLECENITIKNDPFGSAIKSPRNVYLKFVNRKNFIIIFLNNGLSSDKGYLVRVFCFWNFEL
jgi:hypothetical protein